MDVAGLINLIKMAARPIFISEPDSTHTEAPPVSFTFSGLQNLAIWNNESSSFSCSSVPVCVWGEGLRRLANGTSERFLKVQECSKIADAIDKQRQLQRCSVEYRADLLAQVEHLKEERKGIPQRGKQEDVELMMKDLDTQESLLVSWELVWNLSEILYIESLPTGMLVEHLLEWVRRHDNHVDRQLKRLKSGPQPYLEQRGFWDLIYRVVFQGSFKEAARLLEKAISNLSSRDQEGYRIMIKVLVQYPVRKLLKMGTSSQDISRSYTEWKIDCKRKLQNGDFGEDMKLKELAGIICGDETVLVSHSKKFTSWFQYFVGRLLFTDSLVGTNDFIFSHLAEVCYEEHDLQKGDVDEMTLALFRGDLIRTISLSSSSSTNWWFASHLTDLLYHTGSLKAALIKDGDDLREFLLQGYASALMAKQSTWQLAVEYLAFCPKKGIGMLSLLIERLPLTNEKRVHKILQVCNRFNLKEQAQSICHVMSIIALKNNRLGSSLNWAIKAEDEALVSYVAERYLLDYQNSGRMRDMDLLRNLGNSILLTSNLTFLGKYCEFYKLYCEERYCDAGNLLVELLEAEIVPKRFWITLFTDALPLLDVPDPVTLTADQIYTLMGCFEDLAMSKDPDILPKNCENHLGVIRMALCQHLARAILT